MATFEPEPSRTLGYLEGRITEQSKAIEALQSDLKTGLQEVNARLDVGLKEVNARLDAGLKEVRDGQRQLIIATWSIGGGIIATLIGVVVTLIMRGGE